jgi:uncharacterized protein
VPFVSVAVGPDAAVPTINLLAAGLNVVMLLSERRQTRWRDALMLFVPAAIVIPIVGYFVEQLPTDALSVINGVSILAATALLATGARAASLSGKRGAVLAGATSGAMNVATSVGGPPVAMYAVNAGWPAASYRPTVQAYFLGINVVSFAVRGVPDLPSSGFLPAFGAAMLAGWLIGTRLAKRFDDRVVRNLLLLTAAVGGTVAVLRGVF